MTACQYFDKRLIMVYMQKIATNKMQNRKIEKNTFADYKSEHTPAVLG